MNHLLMAMKSLRLHTDFIKTQNKVGHRQQFKPSAYLSLNLSIISTNQTFVVNQH
jgi:hypothetical protein